MPRIGLVFLSCLSLTLCACQSTESQVEDLVRRHLNAMVFVKGGTFMMGNPGGWSIRSDTWPPHKVTLDSFYIQKYEVTNQDFDLFRRVTSYHSSDKNYDSFREKYKAHFAPKLPAIASWRDAKAFCHWLGELSGKSIDLPTEAQWEYAARARGQMLRYATHSGEAYAGINMAPESKQDYLDENTLPNPPGTFPPNPLGIYDMSGNAREWVHDNYQPNYYQHSPELNPEGPKTGVASLEEPWVQKVARGGNIYEFSGNTTITRLNLSEHFVYWAVGFRCAMAVSGAKSLKQNSGVEE